MGNINNSEDAFSINITLIGNNVSSLKKWISQIEPEYYIKKCWKFNFFDEEINLREQVNSYFRRLTKMKDNLSNDIKDCLLVKLKNSSLRPINYIIEKVNSLGQKYYMPLILFLIEDYSEQTKIEIDCDKYKNIDLRLIMFTKYIQNSKEYVNEYINPILLRFCSIHNELGEKFTFRDGDKSIDYDLIEYYYSFNINIACIGRFRQGKSTGVNSILKEYKAKEIDIVYHQTKNLALYQVKNEPIRILDTPGFGDEKTVEYTLNLLKECRNKYKKLKDNIHIFLYFINYLEKGCFSSFEYPIIEELCQHEDSKIIYVFTHSIPNLDENKKYLKIKNINDDLQNITKNKRISSETEIGVVICPKLC